MTNPAHSSQGKQGVDAGPAAFLEHGLLEQLSSDLKYKVFHDGAVHQFSEHVPASDPAHRNMKNPRSVSAVNQHLAQKVYAEAAQGRMVLNLGGDHSIAIGTISGTARAIRERLGREVAVIWVDAHADINTPESSDSGNIHGMPVAFLTGLAKEADPAMFGWIGMDGSETKATNGHGAAETHGTGAAGFGASAPFQTPLNPSKLVYIGLRDVDSGEKKILREHGIKAFSMHDIDKHGIGRVMESALAHIGADTPIHLSFDVDALDPQWAPSTGTPVRGGLTLREGGFICECVAESGQLVAMDLVEVNPVLGKQVGGDKAAKDTVMAGVSLVRCALGDTLL
jgi:arginase